MQCNQPMTGDCCATGCASCGSVVLVHEAHRILTRHGVPTKDVHGQEMHLIQRLHCAMGRMPDPVPPPAVAKEPFADDDPFLPATQATGCRPAPILAAIVWTLYGAVLTTAAWWWLA